MTRDNHYNTMRYEPQYYNGVFSDCLFQSEFWKIGNGCIGIVGLIDKLYVDIVGGDRKRYNVYIFIM